MMFSGPGHNKTPHFSQILIPFIVGLIYWATIPFAFSMDAIIRPYQSVRSSGMGGVRMTTGLYDENFFNNPARVTANPTSKFTLLQITPLEVSEGTLKNASSILNSKDALQTVTAAEGNNLHDRLQIILPAYYLASNDKRKWSLAIGLISSIQIDASLRRSYQTSFEGIADIGPAITIGRKFLRNNNLSVGVTGHFIYRIGTSPNYGLVDYVRGVPLTLNSLGGEGGMVDFDIGATYKLTKLGQFDILLGGAVQNALGGRYSNLGFKPLKIGNPPPAQPRSFGFGVSASRPKWIWFKNTTFALETTDIGINPQGSLFRLVHVGGETHLKSFAFRAGLNQGYWAAGFGIDFHYLTLDLASYGEELGLNTGILEDRRYTLNLGLHI